MTDPIPARKPLKTYSRLEKRRRTESDNDENIKRRRIEEVSAAQPKPVPFSSLRAWLKSSSPAPSLPSTPDDRVHDAPIFSDEAPSCSSPASSPPPFSADSTLISSSTRPTLLPIDVNATTTPGNITRVTVKQSLVQMHINLGPSLQKTCSECGMSYVRSSREDSALHDRFHARTLDGLDLGKPFQKFAAPRAVWRGGRNSLVVAVDAKDKAFERRKVRDVLDIVQVELGAVDIPDAELWSSDLEYRAFLYLDGAQCIGLCLAKRISAAYEVLAAAAVYPDAGLTLNDNPCAADSGISRIWTSKHQRNRGIAKTLLDAVQGHFDPSGRVSKGRIAFSQPTTSGMKLACRWYGRESGWLVYRD